MDVGERLNQISERGSTKAFASCLSRSKARLWYRLDLLVEDAVIVELKSVDQLAPIHFPDTQRSLRSLR